MQTFLSLLGSLKVLIMLPYLTKYQGLRISPRNVQECFERALALEAGYQYSEGISLACAANVKSIWTKISDLNDIRSSDIRARSTANWKCGEISHFCWNYLKFDTSSQSGDNINTVLGEMAHMLTANSPVTDMVLKSISKELICAKVAMKNEKQIYSRLRQMQHQILFLT